MLIVETKLSQFPYKKSKGVYSISKKKLTIPCDYDRINHIEGNLFQVEKTIENNKHVENIINIDNTQLFENWYDDLKIYKYDSSFYYIAELDNKYGIVDINGKEIVPFNYQLKNTRNFLLFMNEDNKYGVIYPDGKVQIPFEYTRFEQIESTNRDSYLLSKEGKTGLFEINHGTQTELIPMEFDDIIKFQSLLIVKKQDKYGLYKSDGIPLAAVEYTNFTLLSNIKSIIFEKEGVSVFFNENGVLVFKSNYSDFMEISNTDNSNQQTYNSPKYYNFLKAKKNKKYVILNLLGKSISELVFDDVQSETKGYFIVQSKGKYGIYSVAKNKVVVDYKYDTILFSEDKFVGMKGNNIDYILINGGVSEIIPSK